MKQKIILALGVYAILFSGLNAQALTESEVNQLSLSGYSIDEIPDQAPLQEVNLQRHQASPDGVDIFGQDQNFLQGDPRLTQISVVLDQVINIGQKVWVIAEKGRPVVNTSTNSASAMPDGIRSWSQLSGWQPSTSRSFRITYQNVYGINVVNFTYRVMYTFGGGFQGRGRFVTGATIIPASLSVAWGWSFNSNVTVPTVVNIGSSENPVGGIQMNLNWKVNTVLVHEEKTSSFFVDGLGRMKVMQ